MQEGHSTFAQQKHTAIQDTDTRLIYIAAPTAHRMLVRHFMLVSNAFLNAFAISPNPHGHGIRVSNTTRVNRDGQMSAWPEDRVRVACTETGTRLTW